MNQVICYIEGDGVGPEITHVMVAAVNTAVANAYKNTRSIEWKELLAGQKAFDRLGTYLPEETLKLIDEHKVAIKGPLTTPVGKGFRSLNVALRQELDLYVCLRPVEYYEGTPSPVKSPEAINMVVFRENTEDIYAGIEWEANTPEVKKLLGFLTDEMKVNTIRFPETSALGVKPVSKEGSERLIRSAIEYALKENRRSVTLVHKGNIMKFTEGGFRLWGFELAEREFGATKHNDGYHIQRMGTKDLIINDCIADAFLQNILTKPHAYDVIATLNLNGDYISDALAAQVGGIGIAPGANINYERGHAIFEATHGTAPDIAKKNIVNPLSLVLSSVLMLRHIGWDEAATLLQNAVRQTIAEGIVTADFFALMKEEGKNATLLGTKEYGERLCALM